MILMHVHLIHPHHTFMILMMSLCSLILMTVTGLTPIIALLMSELPPPLDDLKTVDLGIVNQLRELRIGNTLSAYERDSLLRLLKSYLNVFAWSYEDMIGLDPSIVQHHLSLVPHARPVKQKLRRLHLPWSL